MTHGFYDGPSDRESVVDWCCRDRDRLSEKMMVRYPHFQGRPPAVWVEDLVVDICGFRVHDRPLPKGQLGLCDMTNQIVLINSQMDRFVHHKTDLLALRRSVLAHELGHIQLHRGELQGQFVSRYGRWAQFDDPRVHQREMEADLYAAIFLVPKAWLLQNRQAQGLLRAQREDRVLSSSMIWKAVYQLARAFETSPTLMKRCLLELGWIEHIPARSGTERQNLRIRGQGRAFA